MLRHHCHDVPPVVQDFYLGYSEPVFVSVGTTKLEAAGAPITIHLQEGEVVDMFNPKGYIENYMEEMGIHKSRVRLEELEVFTHRFYIDLTDILGFEPCQGLQCFGFARTHGSIIFIEGISPHTLEEMTTIYADGDAASYMCLSYKELWEDE